MRRIHFNLDATVNYGDLQDQIAKAVQEELSGQEWSAEVQTFDPDGLNISMFIREEGDVFLGHSLADRNYLWMQDEDGKRLLNRYQAVLVPGNWMKGRLLQSPSIRLAPNQIYCVGSPRLDLLRRRQRELGDTPAYPSRLRVLWAPTHGKHMGGSSISSYPEFERFIPRIAEEFDVTVLAHPRHRKSKYAVVDELVGTDVVITDSSSVMYEAWALGKPVIFPDWLVCNGILDRFPSAAEAHVYRARIGYHPENIDQLLDILRSGPMVDEDVHGFMDEYLDNYRGGSASRKVAEILTSLAQNNPHSDNIAIQEGLDTLFESFTRPADAVAGKSVRSSVQLLQLQLLNDRYSDFLDTQVSMNELLRAGGGLKTDAAKLVVELGFMRSDPSVTAEAIAALREFDPVSALGYEAKLRLLSGDSMAAFRLAADYASQGGDTFFATQIVVDALLRIGRRDVAWGAHEKLARTRRNAEDLLQLAALCQTQDELRAFQETADACLGRRPEIKSELLFVDAVARATVQGGDAAAAKELLSDFLLGLLMDKPLLSAVRKAASKSHPHPYSAHPQWLIPFEALPPDSILHTGARHELVMMAGLQTLDAGGCPAFLIAETLHAWLSGEPRHHARAHVKLGVVGRDVYARAATVLGGAPAFHRLASEDEEWSMQFKHVSGPILTIYLHLDDGDSRLYRDAGLEHRGPACEILQESRNQCVVRIPSHAGERVAVDPSTGPTTLTDRTRYCLALYRKAIDAVIRDDHVQISALAAELKELDEPQVDILLATEGKYLPADLAERMKRSRYILHIGDGPDAVFHIDLWLQYCLTADPSLLIAIRSRALFDLLATSRPELPAVYVKEGLHAEWLVQSCTSLRGVLYVSNTGNTIHFLRFLHLRHIFLGHGDSEKTASCHKFFRAYDEVWTAGKAHIDRFKNSGLDFSSLRFRIVGRPTLRPLLSTRGETVQHGRFLYLPTWEGFQAEQNYSSVDISPDFLLGVQALTRKAADIKLHPLTGSRSRKRVTLSHWSRGQTGPGQPTISLLDKATPVAQLMATSDFLLSDVSSVVTDYLCTGKPIFLFMPRERDIRLSSSGMSLDSYAYVFSTPDELLSLIDRVIVKGDDCLRGRRNDALRYYVDVQRTETMQFEKELEKVIREGDAPTTTYPPSPQPSLATSRRSGNLIIGHRGTKASIAENSLAGFRKAAALGIDGIELDVHLSADGVPVVIHDPYLDRTTSSSGAVATLAAAEICSARLKNSDECVPTLEQVIEVTAASGVQLHIEIKNDHLGLPYEGLASKVIAMIERLGVRDRTVLTCFSPEVLEAVRHEDADIPLLASVNYKSAEMLGGLPAALRRFAEIPGCIVSLERGLMRAMTDPALESLGIWVVNDENEMETWFRRGIHMITTDHPALALKMRNRLENKK